MSSGESAPNPIRNPVLYPAELRGLTNDFIIQQVSRHTPDLPQPRLIGIAGSLCTSLHQPAPTRSNLVSAETFAT